MLININDIVTLSNGNEYLVTNKIHYEEKDYFLIINMNDNTDFKTVVIDGFDFVVVKDELLIKKLILLFNKQNIERKDEILETIKKLSE